MNVFQAIVLGLVQGATEFIPVSSSGHLVLLPWLLSWPSPGLAFDTVLHLGTLLALLVIIWPDLMALGLAWGRSVTQGQVRAPAARLGWWVLLGTIPAALMGLLWEEQFEALFLSPLHVSAFLLVTGLWLALSERLGSKERELADIAWWQALLIGLAQGCAIAPGISRSGATIGAGMLLGLRRDAATRFSFLLSTPIILAAGLLQVRRLLALPNVGAQLLPLALGFLAAFLSGYACIRFLLNYVKQRSLNIFAAYCWLVGLGTLIVSAAR